MVLPNVFINVTGQIVRPTASKDGIAALIFFNDNIANLTTFGINQRTLKFNNIQAVESLGITSTSTNFKKEHFIISEFFRMGGGDVYIHIAPLAAQTFTFVNEMTEVYQVSNGEVRIYGIFMVDFPFSFNHVSNMQTVLDSFKAEKKPAVGVYGGDYSTLDLVMLLDARNQTAECPSVSVVIGQDTDITTKSGSISQTEQISMPNIGAYMGALSTAKVSENVLHVEKYNYASGAALSKVGFYASYGTIDGLIQVNQVAKADLDELNEKGYVFWRYFPNYAGSFLSNDNNCARPDSTFNSLKLVRVENKVIRELDAALTPFVGSPLLFNADGTLKAISRVKFESAAAEVLQSMVTAQEISNYSVYVDPKQDSLSTKTVRVQAQVQPIESADWIYVDVAFVSSIA